MIEFYLLKVNRVNFKIVIQKGAKGTFWTLSGYDCLEIWKFQRHSDSEFGSMNQIGLVINVKPSHKTEQGVSWGVSESWVVSNHRPEN